MTREENMGATEDEALRVHTRKNCKKKEKKHRRRRTIFTRRRRTINKRRSREILPMFDDILVIKRDFARDCPIKKK